MASSACIPGHNQVSQLMQKKVERKYYLGCPSWRRGAGKMAVFIAPLHLLIKGWNYYSKSIGKIDKRVSWIRGVGIKTMWKRRKKWQDALAKPLPIEIHWIFLRWKMEQSRAPGFSSSGPRSTPNGLIGLPTMHETKHTFSYCMPLQVTSMPWPILRVGRKRSTTETHVLLTSWLA